MTGSKRQSKNLSEAGRFLVVGISNILVSFVVFYLCFEIWEISNVVMPVVLTTIKFFGATTVNPNNLSFDATISTVIGYSAGVINSFLLNSSWTFGVAKRSTDQFLMFLVLNLMGLTASGALMYLIVDSLHYNYIVAWIFVTGIVVVLNFLGCKYWVFVDE